MRGSLTKEYILFNLGCQYIDMTAQKNYIFTSASKDLFDNFCEAIESYLALCESEGIEQENPSLPD